MYDGTCLIVLLKSFDTLLYDVKLLMLDQLLYLQMLCHHPVI